MSDDDDRNKIELKNVDDVGALSNMPDNAPTWYTVGNPDGVDDNRSLANRITLLICDAYIGKIFLLI